MYLLIFSVNLLIFFVIPQNRYLETLMFNNIKRSINRSIPLNKGVVVAADGISIYFQNPCYFCKRYTFRAQISY